MTSPAEMDEAAKEAKADLGNCTSEKSVSEIAAWWKKWYMTAGHKRLGRILVTIAKESQAASSVDNTPKGSENFG